MGNLRFDPTLNHPLNNMDYSAFQLILPLDLAIRIPENDPLRSFVEVLEGVNLKRCLKRSLKGRHDYEDLTLLKILLFAQMNQIYSLRQIESACKTDIRFMWLAQGITPSHMTFQRLITQRLKGKLEMIFLELNRYLIEREDINTDILYIDGTKLEANARKNSFVWKKAVLKHRERLYLKISKIFIERGIPTQNTYHPEDVFPHYMHLLSQIHQSKIEFVKGKGQHKTPLQRDYETLKGYYDKLSEYNTHLTICGERNSYSKTDPDATFMHMKEDYYMRTGIFKPGYNIQLGVSDEYILMAKSFPNPNDTLTFIPLLQAYHMNYGKYPLYPVGDAGYGSYDNYLYCLNHQMELVQKYNTYEAEKNGKYRKDPFYSKNMIQSDGTLKCPNHKSFVFKKETIRKVGLYPRFEQVYQCVDCAECPLSDLCLKGESNRSVTLNPILNELQAKAKDNLDSEWGIQLRIQRSIQSESTFGILKNNWGKLRFNRRGKENVENERLLLSIGYNLMKFHQKKYRKSLN